MADVCLVGDLTFTTVNQKREELLRALGLIEKKRFQVSLQNVGASDSAALALMAEGMRYARSLGKTITYVDAPNQLARLAEFCRVDFMLEK